MPGYEYDQFGGNVGALTRWMLAVPLPFLQTPLKIGNATIPADRAQPLLPVLLGVHRDHQRRGASRRWTRSAPKWSTASRSPSRCPRIGIKSTQEIRLSLFGTLLGFGVARPLEGGHQLDLHLLVRPVVLAAAAVDQAGPEFSGRPFV